ncbi:MAG: TlpA family protein disulfide reductase [Saprospirales bacterium]|nr:MAG: TlpA family protein disulfide reductase [Saprospirales bacterium]
MKNISILSLVAILFGLTIFSCSSPEQGLTLEGQFDGAANLSVVFEHLKIGEDPIALARTNADAEGNFVFELNEPVQPGIYRVRIGAQGGDLILTGEERMVEIKGDMSALAQNQFEVTGSEDTQELIDAFTKALANSFSSLEDILEEVESFDNAYTAVQFSMRALQTRPQFASVHEAASARLIKEYPGTDDAENYAGMVAQISQAAAAQSQQNPGQIRVGMEAPDIEMEGPDGEIYRLSDLRGSVVLLDFWAAWCRPCRIANPHVVEIYNRYKDRGFKVFNVSLDGLDSRSAARFPDQETLEQQMAIQRQRWMDAIEQDGLNWPYHVSELKRWECSAAQKYGVRSIPRTFLIDKEGRVAAINPKPQTNLESELLRLL